MYLLGNREAQTLGITSTYGNSSLDVVHGSESADAGRIGALGIFL